MSCLIAVLFAFGIGILVGLGAILAVFTLTDPDPVAP